MSHRTIGGEPHGGDLQRARALFGEGGWGEGGWGDGDWQDLSTGISPWPWPVPPVPASIWQRLPEGGGPLSKIAAHYYGVDEESVLPLPGSQFGIARLPHHLSSGRVALPALGYAEHERAWRGAGHELMKYDCWDGLESLIETGSVNHLVLINPNNPTAERLPLDTLRGWLRQLPDDSVVLVDEAFADLTPQCSVVPLLKEFPSLWVLRSVGKFFGLAGVRLGFLLGQSDHWLRRALASELEPWGVSHLAQWVGAQALSDEHWQREQRERLAHASRQLEALWRRHLDTQCPQVTVANGGLFVTLRGPAAVLRELHTQLAARHLWLRLGEDPHRSAAWLRCGLPADGGRRLAQALDVITINIEENA
ncbi:threonine-phosphate decarboxylase [Marinimicrobium agarilyticum]|uniref:threonine-phosphate decarboxylase n=1 Tax=Marinimicrobium agarilyticum TaxID=306546 RepID=UPI000423B328|nr:threonine-phosphate decarboxylase [Marinimicrobium agarilyticum]